MAESNREEIAKLEALYAGNPGGRVFVHLAEAYRKAGEHERARRILEEGLARHTDSASGYVVLGRVLADMQVMGDAEAAFRRVLELDGGNLVALRWLGDLARQAGRNAEAATHYRELLVRNPSNEEVRDLVEIVEREAAAPPVAAAEAEARGAAEPESEELADWSVPREGGEKGPEDEFAVAEPVSELEAAAVTAPEPREDPADSAVTPWSAAPGQTADGEESPVEFGIVEIESLPGGAQSRDEESEQEAAFRWDRGDEESDLVASIDDDADGMLELDDLSRNDEAEPVEIHLLDPSYEATAGAAADDSEVYADLDVSDLTTPAPLEDEYDYADDAFVADLTSARPEEPDEDELPAVLDVMEAGSALTLLPEDDASAPDESLPSEPEDDWRLVTADEAEHVEPLVLDADIDDEQGSSPAEAELNEVGMTELAGAAEPAAESSTVAEVRRDADTGLVTETMAVLYRSQGFHDRAADVYRALLRTRPDDERLVARLREAEEAAAVAAPAPEEDAGEVWLRGVGTAWTADRDTAPEEATPYAWTGEPEDSDAGEPISAYLQDLVSWKAGQVRWMDPAVMPEADPSAGDTGEMPDWMNGPAGSATWTHDAAAPPETAPAAHAWDRGPAGEAPVAAEAGWTPLELEPDIPPRTAALSEAPRPAAPQPDPAAEDSSEDEDLEMFRSWLQSLKK